MMKIIYKGVAGAAVFAVLAFPVAQATYPATTFFRNSSALRLANDSYFQEALSIPSYNFRGEPHGFVAFPTQYFQDRFYTAVARAARLLSAGILIWGAAHWILPHLVPGWPGTSSFMAMLVTGLTPIDRAHMQEVAHIFFQRRPDDGSFEMLTEPLLNQLDPKGNILNFVNLLKQSAMSVELVRAIEAKLSKPERVETHSIRMMNDGSFEVTAYVRPASGYGIEDLTVQIYASNELAFWGDAWGAVVPVVMQPSGSEGDMLVYKGQLKRSSKFELKVRAFAKGLDDIPEAHQYSEGDNWRQTILPELYYGSQFPRYLREPATIIYMKPGNEPHRMERIYQPQDIRLVNETEHQATEKPVTYPAGSLITATRWAHWFLAIGSSIQSLIARDFHSEVAVVFLKGRLMDGRIVSGLLWATTVSEANALREAMIKQIQNLNAVISTVAIWRPMGTYNLRDLQNVDMAHVMRWYRIKRLATLKGDLIFDTESGRIRFYNPRSLAAYPQGYRHQPWAVASSIGIDLKTSA